MFSTGVLVLSCAVEPAWLPARMLHDMLSTSLQLYRRLSSDTLRNVLGKLILFAVLMAVAPIGTYFGSLYYVWGSE
jgi:hypothetical protein